jgi:diacylglycerol kinase
MSVSTSKLIRSFGHAFDGWRFGLRERNIKIHLFIAVCVVSASIFFNISAAEWLIVFILIGMVISAELFNTAIEEICDLITTKLKLQYSDTTVVRDLSAGAVLVIAVVAALIGLIIFIPKVLILFL